MSTFLKTVKVLWGFTPSDIKKFHSVEGTVSLNILDGITVVQYPTLVNNNLIYDGTEQFPEWSGYDASIMTISGITSAIEAGKYNVIFTLNDTTNYIWQGGSIDPITIEWSIGRAIIDTVPTQATEYNYTGSTITAEWNNYDSNKMFVTGDTAINAGTYTAIFVPTINYQWSDGTINGKEVQWIIHDDDTNIIPTTTGMLVYDGTEQSPEWVNYDSTKLTISGITSAVESGIYTATFVPIDNYEWEDGTSDPKNVDWMIDKATIEVPIVSTVNNIYTGNEITPIFNGYDSNKMTIGGTTSSSALGTYTTTFTPLDNYKWSDGFTITKEVQWSIVNPSEFIVTAENRSMVGYNSTITELNIPGTFTGEDGIPYTVVGIGDNAFANCNNLVNVNIPNTVKSIDDYAFNTCVNLTTVNIPNSVTEISIGAFMNCALLKNVTIPNSVTYIGRAAFQATGIISIVIPSKITSLDRAVFQNCTKLATVTIYRNLSFIGGGAFYGCSALRTVNYTGSQSDWTYITIESASTNTPLTNATKVYNYTV